MKRLQFPEYIFPYAGEWQWVLDKDIQAKSLGDREALDYFIANYQQNPLAYTLMHGRPNKKYGNDGLAFINDWTNDLPALFAGSQQGKSFGGASKMGFYALPMDPESYCFQNHGIEYREWGGPREIIIASYSWPMTQVLWNTYLKVWPRKELGVYAPMWGRFPGEKGRAKSVNLQNNGVTTVQMTCGTRVTMLAFEQKKTQWEGRQCHAGHMDEQGEEDIFNSLCARQTTMGDYTPIFITLTGYMYEDRPDTGGGGWIKRKIVDGVATKGRTYKEYRIRLEDVPEVFCSAKAKQAIIVSHIEEPMARKDLPALRHGKAVVNGEWEEGGGAVIAAYQKDIHCIMPFDVRKYHPTYYRMVDPGDNPTAAMLIALMPWGDAVVFKEHYEFGKSQAMNAKMIVEDMCGNERVKVDEFMFEDQTWPVLEERTGVGGYEVYGSEMDSRSFASKGAKESGRTTGQAYIDYGCRVTPASGKHDFSATDRGAISLLREWFELDIDRTHINKRLGRPVPEEAKQYGSPRVYLFDDLRHFRAEISGWMKHPKTGKPHGDDHLIDCFKYFAGRFRDYQGDYRFDDNWEDDNAQETDEYTRW